MEIKAKEQDRKELIPFQTICMHCYECHFPISASWMGEVGLRLRLRKTTPLSAFFPLLWQQVVTLGWGNLVQQQLPPSAPVHRWANCELLCARSESTSGALSSLLVANGLDTAHKVGLFNSGCLLGLAVTCVLHCCFPLVLNKLCLYLLLVTHIHFDLSSHLRFPYYDR